MEEDQEKKEKIQFKSKGDILPSSLLFSSSSSALPFFPQYHYSPVIGLDIRTFSMTQKRNTPKDLILTIDISGSMSSVIPMVRQMVLTVINSMDEHDRLAVVLFDSTSEILFDLQYVPNKSALNHYVEKIAARGSTNISAGLELAVEVVAKTSPTKEEDRLSLVMLLSDGQPTDGICDAKELRELLQKKLATIPNCKTLVYSFGFTSNHSSTIMNSITDCGSHGKGMYYFLQTQEDIGACIGDCLGSLNRVIGNDINIIGTPLNETKQPCSEWKTIIYSGMNLQDQISTVGNLPMISANERHTFLFQCVPSIEQFSQELKFPSYVSFKITYLDTEIGVKIETNNICEIPVKQLRLHSSSMELKIEEESEKVEEDIDLNLLTHVLRVRAANELIRMIATGTTQSMIPELEAIHEKVMETLQKVQQIKNDEDALYCEGILVCIERDIGEVLEKFHSFSSLNSSMTCHFLQLANEHLKQKSASSASHLGAMSPYATPEQLSMRLRFLYANFNESPQIKQEVKREEPDLTEEELEHRKTVDENTHCYITLENWRECQLGIGLLVRPRTSRERYRGLIPRVEIVEDYVSAEAYNQGVRGMVTNVNQMLNRDDSEEETKYSALKSSIRGRINAWLPLYINSTNWKFAKSWSTSAFSIVATQFSDLFQPEHALKVCSKLMIQTVVKSLLEDACLSEKTIQMFCDIHRLFLQTMEEYPQVKVLAERALQNFISIPPNRRRAVTPDLGDLIMYLTITDKVSWDDIKEPYVVEMIRRSSLHAGNIHLPSIGSAKQLMQTWLESTGGAKVTSFNVAFLHIIAHPPGKTIQDVIKLYDNSWGRISESKIKELKEETRQILTGRSLSQTLEFLLGKPISNEAILELLLWSFENKFDDSKDLFPNLPSKAGPYTKLWQRRKAIFEYCILNPPPELEFWKPLPKRKKSFNKNLWAVSSTLEFISQKQSALEQGEKKEEEISNEKIILECDCKRCQNERRIQVKREEWKHQTNPNSNPLVLFIGNIKESTTEEDIQKKFSSYGQVECIHFVKHHETKVPRGYGFVTFKELKKEVDFPEMIIRDLSNFSDQFQMIDKVKGHIDPNFYPVYLGGPIKKF